MVAVEPVRILGVDPGTRVAGWGVIALLGNGARVVACGAIRTRGPEIEKRLSEFARELREIIATHSPATMAVERPFLGKNPQSALSVGMARGVAVLAAGEAGLPLGEYTPATVKKAVVGRGNASKEQVAAMVRVLLGLAEAPRPADVTDALAVALAHAHRGAGAAGHTARGRPNGGPPARTRP